MMLAQRRRDYQLGHLPAQGFLSRVAERFLSCRVELYHSPLRVHADDSVECRRKDGGLPRLGLAHSLLDALALKKLANLCAQGRHCVDDGPIRFSYVVAEKLEHAENLTSEEDGKR